MPSPFYATVTTTGYTIWLPDYSVAPFTASVQVLVPGGTTATYEVDYSLIDPNFPVQALPPPNWLPMTGFPAGSTGSLLGALASPLAQLRLNVSAISGGPIYFNCLQGGFIGS